MQAQFFTFKKTQLLAVAIASVTQAFCNSALAAPEGAQVVAGEGTIEQIEKETRIQQASERLSIDWKSFDINSDERVQFIQPNSSSIAFNRILSNKGSLIQGRIDANGQVVLINPNGLIFTDGASVNAGGLIASALQMNSQDYLNGRFTLNALEGSEGRVINSGLLNAATGGSISLIGQSVENKGLISASLGSINLVAGKEAVLTFESNGLVGVRITEAMLQKDLGVDAAVINSGEIKAEGGKVLITASTSKDIFSKAVNSGELSPAKSAVVNEDGSFTLGSGADVKNIGTISVAAEHNGGEAVIIGETVVNEGTITADSQSASAGSIEVSARALNETQGNGKATAVAHTRGQGGDIKLLGENVGLLDHAKIDASGADGGGQVLLGGDKTGANKNIHNAKFIYLGEKTKINSDATQAGQGGRVIAFAEDTARIYGSLSARGGIDGRGGFVETSGLKGFDIYRAPDLSSLSGIAGEWLIDPNNIFIASSGSFDPDLFERQIETDATTYTAISDSAVIGWSTLLGAGIANVLVKTTDGDITIQNSYYFAVGGTKSTNITFDAGGDIKFNSGLVVDATKVSGQQNAQSSDDSLSLIFKAAGSILLNDVKISTNGGDIKIGTTQAPIGGTVSAANATLNTSSANGPGDISIDAKGNVALGKINIARTSVGQNDKATKIGSLTVTSQSSIAFEQDIDVNNASAYNGNPNNNESWTIENLPDADKKLNFILNAAGDINFKKVISDSYGDGRDALNITANADAEVMTGGKNGIGSVIVGNTVYTSGGNVTLSGAGIQFGASGLIDTDRANGSPDNSVTGNGGHGNATRSEGGDVTLSSDSTIELGSITTDHFCTLGTCTGDLTVQNRSDNKTISITQANGTALSIHGTTTLKSSGGTITLDKANNIFGTAGTPNGTNSNSGSIDSLVTNARVAAGKAIAITNAGTASIKGDNSYLTLGNVTAQSLTLSTSKDIRQIGGASIDVDTSAFKGTSVLLVNSGNKFDAISSFATTSTTAGSASINTAGDITLSALNIASGQLSLTLADGKSASFDGVITSSSPFTVTAAGANTAANLADSLSKSGGSTVTFAGFNTLHYAGSKAAQWDLTANAQTVSWDGKTFKFDGVARLVGGGGVDTFAISGTPFSVPSLDGAAADVGDDVLTLNASNATASNNWLVELGSSSAAAVGKIRATGIESLTVTNVPANVVAQLTIGNAKDTSWNLTGASSIFTLNNEDAGEVGFAGFTQISGGDGKDTFDYSGVGSQVFSGKIDGAGGAEDVIKGFNADTAWDLTATPANFYKAADSSKKYNFSGVEKLVGGTAKDTVTLAASVTEVNLDAFSTGFSLENFEGITATAQGGAKLTGYSGDSTWEISNANQGKITSGSGKSTEFAGFSALASSNAQNNKDKFTVTATGSVSSITGQAGDTLNVRSSTTLVNNWLINADGSAQVKEGSTTYINKISGVGTINASVGADNFTAAGTYNGTIKATQGIAVEDKNTLLTANADIVLGNTISANGIEGITEFNADGTTAQLKASSAGAVNWTVTPGSGAGQLSGSVTDVTSGKNLSFSDFATLVGGDNDDNFTLGAGTFNGGAVQGGAGKNALINTVANATWDLSTTKLRTVLFSGIQTLRGLSGDSLKAPNATNTFTLDSTSARLESADTNNLVTKYTLENFTTLVGGDNQDTFKVDVDAADVTFQGGKGNDTFTLANKTIKTQSLQGGEDSDTLRVNQGTNEWILTAANTGTVNSNPFNTMEILVGAGADSFENKLAGQTLSLTAIDAGSLHASSNVNAEAIRLSGMNSVKNLAQLEGFNDTAAWALNTDGAGTVKTAVNTSLNFTGVTTLIGGSGNETFTLGKDVTTFDIKGGLGVNTLQGADFVNQWKLTGQVASGNDQPVANIGTLNSTGQFTAIQTLKGGSLADTLDLTGSSGLTVALANIAGFESLIGGTNSSLTANNQTNSWQLNAGTKGLINSIAFENFTTLNGGTALDIFSIANGSQFKGEINGGVNTSSSVRDEVKIDSVAGTFTVTAQGKGTLEYINTTNSTATSVKFDEIETLTGGSAADTFDVATKVDMSLNGGEGKDSITLPKEIDDITLAVGSGVPSVGSLTLSNFEKVQADASIKGTLRAFDGEATWVISNENIGTLTLSKDSQTSVTEFGNFNKLVSGNGVDHFIFGDNGSVTTIQADSLDDLEARNRATHWELTSTLKLTDTASTKVYADSISGLNKWQGGKEADNFNLSAFAGDLIDLTIDGGGGQNQFTSPAGTWSWTLTDSQKGELTAAAQKIRFAKINTLVGGANQTLTNSANVDGWKVSQTNLLTADIGGLATQLKDFGTVNTGNSGDVLVIDAAYTGAINLQGGANSVNLGAAGSITTLSAGGAQDTITSALTKSIWTLTENTDKRFITVKATAESANPIINELFGFESIFVTTTNNTLASTLNDNKWTIAAANTGLLNNIKFSGFDQLIGSDGKDTFSFTTGDAFVGTIDGKLGDNLVDVSTGGQTKFELKAAEGVEFKGVKGATGVTGAGATAQLNLVSDNKASWTISDENSGELIYSRIVNDVQVDTKISFAGFGILVGGTGNDVFSFSSNGKLSSIDGGAGSGSDSLMAKPNQSNQWSLAVGSTPNNTLANFNNGMAGPMYLADFDGIETIVGAGQDRLLVESGTTRWSLTKNAGTLINSPLVAGAADLALKFSGFKTLWGSDAKDTYNLVEVPEFADIDGRGGENLVQLAAQDAVLDLTQGFAVQGVKNVTGVSGSGANASLTLVANSNATWTLTDKNAGAIKVTISGQEKSIAFDNFINLTGGSNNDAFILDAKGYVTGAINGGGTSNGGQNSLTAWSGENANWILNSNSSVAASTSGFKQSFSGITLLNGSEKVDTFDVQSAQTLSINAGLGDDTLILRSNGRLNGQFDGGQNVNTVQTIDGANSWQLTSATSGSVLVSGETTSRASFSQVSRLIGGSGLDNLIGFNTAATWEVGATSGIIVTGTQGADKTNFSKMDVLTGGEQSDVFKVSGAFAGDIFGKGGSDTLELLSNGSVLNFTGGTQGADATGDKIIGPVAGAVWQFNTDKNTLTDKNGTPLLGNFQEVETLQADTTGEDTLVSTLVDNSWNLSSANAGLFNGAINFNGFDYLTGSDLKDSFVFNFVGTFGKGVDAGKGDNSVQLNLVNRVELDWADKIVNGVKGANIIIGSNSVESELSLQSSVGLTWIIDRLDGGVISDGTSSFKFDQYKNLKGSLASDDFRFTNAGAISTSIDGGNGDGIDSLTGLVGDNTWQLGQTFAITGQSGTYVKNAAGFERLLGNLNKDTFNVNTRVKASITGGDGDDRLVLAAGSQLEGSFNGNLGDNTVESQLAASRWELSSVVTGVISNGDETALRFSNANKMQALASGDNQLSFAGLTADLQWLINSGSNERAGGQVAVTGQAPATQFSGFNRITGAKGADDMTLAAAVSEINLGEGNNRLTLQTGAKVNSLLAGTGRDELRSFAAASLWQMLSATEGKLSTTTADVVGQFSGVEVFTGSGNDRLSAAALGNKWVLSGPGGGTLNGTYTFSGFGRVQGNIGADAFEVQALGSMANVDGGEGDDSLIARNSANTWNFSRNDSGTLRATGEQAAYLTFSGLETFTGAQTAADSITLDPQVSQVKLAAGGQAEDELFVNYRDRLELSSDGTRWLGISGVKKVTAQALTASRSAQLTSTASAASRWTINEENGGDWTVGVGTASASSTHFSGFDTLQGSSAGDEYILSNGRISTLIDGGAALPGAVQNDSLLADNKLTYWTVTGTGAGSLTYFDPNSAVVQRFAGIETLIGNGSNDEFRLQADGISINIRGGNSTGVDKVSFNGALDITLGQQDVVGVGIAEIETFDADPTKQNTLRSSAAGGNWTLTGANSGTLVSGSEQLRFNNFQNLLGGKGTDEFVLDENARVSGLLSGGDGDNSLRISHNRDLTATLTADGAGDLAASAAIARFEQIKTLEAVPLAQNLSATLTAANQPNQWVLTDNKVALNGFNYTGFTQLIGQDGADDFLLNGKQTLSIDGKNGSDSLTLNSAQGTVVSWQLTGATGTLTAAVGGNTQLIAPLFSNIEQLIGGAGDDVFVLTNTGNRYSRFDGGAGNNSLSNSSANNQWQLGGLPGDGSAVVDRLNNAQVVRIQTLQGSGSDSLLGSDDKTLWLVGRGGQLSLSQTNSSEKRSLTATGMSRFQGGKGQDDFVLQETGSGSFARMDGGAVGADSVTGVNTSSVRDSLDARAVSADVQVNLNEVSASTSLAANQLVVSGIEILDLNATANNTLYGPTLANNQAISWQISQAKQGSFAPKLGAHGENTVTFSGVSNLIAGAGEDRFALATAEGLGGDLDGGEGTDYLDYSQANLAASQTSFDVVIGESTRLRNIDGVIGKNTSSMRLVVKSNGSQWLLDDMDADGTTSDGVNDGRVTLANGQSVVFIDFAALVGTQGADKFDLKGGFNGSITTGEGADSLVVGVNPNRAQAIKLINDVSDSLSLSWQGAAPAGVKETYKQVASGRESITLESLTPALSVLPFSIEFNALANIDDSLAVDEMRVQTAFETAGSNRLMLNQNALQLSIDSPSGAKVGTWFKVNNKTNLILSGQVGDQLTLSGNSQLAGALSLEKFAISAQGEQSLGAGQINFNGVASIGSAQQAVRVATPVVQFNSLRGDAWVTSSGDIKLASLDGQGKLNLRADGNIGQTQQLSYTRDLNLAASGSINLDNPDNRLTGGLSFNAANAVTLANGLTSLAALNAEQFTYSGQDLTASGPLVVAGATSLTSTGSIEALNPANRLARVQVNAAGSAKLALGTDSSLVGAKVGGTLQAQADGLTVAGDLTAAALELTAGQPATGAGQLKVSGQLNAPQISLTAGDLVLKTQLQGSQLSLSAKSVSLEKSVDLSGDFSAQVDSLQQASDAAIASKGAVTINATGALQLDGAITSGRDLSLVAGGSIAQSGAWRTDGLTASGEGKAATADVIVKSGGNITQQSSASTQSAGAITYEAAGTIRVASLVGKGEVMVNATAGIEDANGTATNITAPSARLISGGNVNGLDLSVDSLIGQFAGAAQTVSLRNDKTLRVDRLVTNASEPGAVTTIATARGDVIFNNDLNKNPELASLYAKTDLPQEKTGLVNSNYASGTLNIVSEKGRVRATGTVNAIQPDLVANNINIFSALGVSTPSRPLVIYSAGNVLYTGTGLNWKPYAAFKQGFKFSSDNALDLSQLLLAAGDQLIEVEPLEDVNPAVFTDVRNYSADNLSIMLPADQRYEE